MARPLDLIVEEMLDYIEQARSYTQDMTFDQYSSDAKTQRAVERCIEVISEASRHVPEEIKGKYSKVPWPSRCLFQIIPAARRGSAMPLARPQHVR